ncbi:hypothetical protein [Alteromonas macleodii]|uniref:hypothetical protein n=1 Tax=Alteromonas macleodii TaxID=28108 RepID=UPI00313E93D6
MKKILLMLSVFCSIQPAIASQGLNFTGSSYAVNGESSVEAPNVGSNRFSDVQKNYKRFIMFLASNVEDYTKVEMKSDGFREKIDVSVMFSWSLPSDMVEDLAANFGGSWSESHYLEGTEARVSTMSLDTSELQSIYTKYAIFHVVRVGDKKVELPILVPVRADKFKLDIKDICSDGVPLNKRGNNFYLCIASRFTRLASVSGEGMLKNFYELSKTDEFSLPLGINYNAKKYIEVREWNGTVLKTIEL